MTSFDPEYLARFGHPFKGWDDPRPTKQCLHCNGTGMADPDNECGFCFRTPDSGDLVIRLRSAARSGDLPLGISFDCDAVADEIERLRAERDAIDTLHHPVSSGKDDEVCNNCGCFWPCTTHSLLHPKEARHG